MSKCIITLPSMTFAQKARKTLASNGISATAEKLSPEQAEGGCSWGVEVTAFALDEAIRILNVSDIPWKRILREPI